MVKGIALPEEEFLNECLELVRKAQEKNIIIRILGALAVYIKSENCPRCRELHRSLGRLGEGVMFTDLDVMTYKKQRKDVKKFLEKELGYVGDRYVNTMFGGKRNIYYHPKNYFYVDVFFSKLEFSHDVNFGEKPGKGRLELDYPTITLTDIVLEKLQIHEINKKDLIDLIVLFLGHGFSEKDEKDKVNAKYIAKILADDWGFWYDATNNLNKVKQIARKFTDEGKMKEEEYNTVAKKVNELLEYIENEPKTKNWVKRSRTGTKKLWYRVVEEVNR